MTLRNLEIFVTVYREMSITKAARKLHLAQPGVSLAIKEMEEEYRVRLFDRINRRLSATEKGDQMYAYATHILEMEEEMENAMTAPDVPVNLRLGASITIGTFLVPRIVKCFRERYPTSRLQVTIQNSQQVIRAVIRNEQDLGVVEDRADSDQLRELPFMKDELCFLCGADHPLASRESVTLEEICCFPLYLREKGSASREITENLLRTCAAKGEILWESVSNEALAGAIKENPGITVLSARLVEKELKEGSIQILPLHPDAFMRSFSLIHHRKKYLTEPMQFLMDLFKKTTLNGARWDENMSHID
ncbi:MAG: LysR family transcriptional regulator [Lachnospiraceae bacterium]|nr:LysR family transcriptional regulator [Lachnospiraceae bacterium]